MINYIIAVIAFYTIANRRRRDENNILDDVVLENKKKYDDKIVMSVGKDKKDINILNIQDIRRKVYYEKEDFTFIDIRSCEEMKYGYIEGSILMENFLENPDRIKNLDSKMVDKKIIIYCRSGKRAEKAADIFSASGFNNVSYLDGGFDDLRNLFKIKYLNKCIY